MQNKLSYDEFVERSKLVHGDRYDYSKVVYTGYKKSIIITCKKHGDFNMSPSLHISNKAGCKECKNDKFRDTTESFIKKAIKIHGDKYDYSKVNYINSKKIRVEILCQKHGSFFLTPRSHLSGNGCEKCSYEAKTYSNKEFIDLCNKVHNNLYTYELCNYKNMDQKVWVSCEKHGPFELSARNHCYLKIGCSECCTSKNEIFIEQYLIKNKIMYQKQKSFENCKFRYHLKFDFYIPKYNTCI